MATLPGKDPNNLVAINESPIHRLTLQDWSAQHTASCENVVRKLSIRNTSTSELYQILGFFFVFQGVVITAVAQGGAVKCHNSWLLLVLSAIVSVATFCACIQKLREIEEAKREYLKEKAVCSDLFQRIEQLKSRGVHGDLEQSDLPPFHCPPFWKTWMWSSAGAVFLLLLAFTGFTLAAVRLIACDSSDRI